MVKNLNEIKQTLIKALSHQEAEDGLFFRNFYNMHEADERPAVNAEKAKLAEALNELIAEGKVKISTFDDEIIFLLAK